MKIQDFCKTHFRCCLSEVTADASAFFIHCLRETMRVVIIGAGLSSALISVLLRGHYGPGIKLVVYDKSKSIGKSNHLPDSELIDSS